MNTKRSLLPVLMLLPPVFVPGVVWAKEASTGKARKPLPGAEVIAKLPKDGGEEFNRLVFETSPYLLQHARNPVDWYPWGEEAFALAKETDRPVFLSIGYTTCHWCHVMEHESFEDMEYFAGTYFPKESRFGRPGLVALAHGLADAWKNDREKVREVAAEVTRFLGAASSGAPGEPLEAGALDLAFAQLQRQYDSQYGGFGRDKKFPTAHQLSFLVRYWKRTGEADALLMVEHTLSHIRNGGIYDHVGHGVHRYSTDRQWLVPHFEKMLYDQAILAIACLDAYQATGKEAFSTFAREIFSYVMRDMQSTEGGFFSAEDADSEGVEGKFYLWQPSEVAKVLGKERAARFNKIYNIREGGNFQDEATGKPSGENIPHLEMPLSIYSVQHKVTEDVLRKLLEEDRLALFDYRKGRIHPQKDDKVLTDWNGIMVAALARAGEVLDEQKYTDAAKAAADFCLAKLRREDGRLLKRYREGQAGLPGHLEDYAFLTWGLLNLYESTFEVAYLQEAVQLNKLAIRHFWDDKAGGFFMTADDGEKLLVRHKELYDGAIPSGNSVAAMNFLRLARITGDTSLEDRASKLMQAFSKDVVRSPSAYTQLLQALDFATSEGLEIVVAGELSDPRTQELLKAVRLPFLPNKVVLLRPAGEKAAITEIASYTEAQEPAKDGAPRVFVCSNFQCKRPVSKADEVLGLLEGKK
jgi:uncharacterized protein YyaL (SSP411 family)